MTGSGLDQGMGDEDMEGDFWPPEGWQMSSQRGGRGRGSGISSWQPLGAGSSKEENKREEREDEIEKSGDVRRMTLPLT